MIDVRLRLSPTAALASSRRLQHPRMLHRAKPSALLHMYHEQRHEGRFPLQHEDRRARSWQISQSGRKLLLTLNEPERLVKSVKQKMSCCCFLKQMSQKCTIEVDFVRVAGRWMAPCDLGASSGAREVCMFGSVDFADRSRHRASWQSGVVQQPPSPAVRALKEI